MNCTNQNIANSRENIWLYHTHSTNTKISGGQEGDKWKWYKINMPAGTEKFVFLQIILIVWWSLNYKSTLFFRQKRKYLKRWNVLKRSIYGRRRIFDYKNVTLFQKKCGQAGRFTTVNDSKIFNINMHTQHSNIYFF